ncbi:hypothetical protein [Polaribacter sp. Asnod1-A03]|uniref:hypothetical protein n=1 Tax=Polaribacter sp. Asnod1-A03 TaxID=3160581 RepID=UPI00386490AA
MNKIELFLDTILAYYPERWENIDGYIKSLMPYEEKDPFSPFKSKYYKKFIPVIDNEIVTYVPEELASKSYKGLNKILYGDYVNYLIDFKELLNDCEENDFDIESWSDKRKDNILKEINEFLFDCNVYKGVFFFSKLSDVFSEIIANLDYLEKVKPIYSDNPNWLQIKIKKTLKLEIESLKSILIYNYKPIYGKIDNVLNRINLPKNFNKHIGSIWYKLAKIMAEGYLVIAKNHYIINGEIITNESEVARSVSKHLNGNYTGWESFKPYLNQTKSNANNDKNIFFYSRLEILNFIAVEVEKNDGLSDYFKIELLQLKKRQNY